MMASPIFIMAETIRHLDDAKVDLAGLYICERSIMQALS
jgi:hypothetical protein